MAEWDPEQYLRFKQDRLRPAIDLLHRVQLESPSKIVDLGCGPGTSSEILAKKFPTAQVTGIDNSAAMIERATRLVDGVRFLKANLQEWEISEPVDLIFANAVFHWIPDHQQLLSRLSKNLKPGGVIAFQMPDNLGEPSHIAINELADQQVWSTRLSNLNSDRSELPPIGQYYDWLARDFREIDIWRTVYQHVMPGPEHIVEWIKGAALVPYLEALAPDYRAEYLREYLAEITARYPLQADGNILFSFPRLFVVAIKR